MECYTWHMSSNLTHHLKGSHNFWRASWIDSSSDLDGVETTSIVEMLVKTWFLDNNGHETDRAMRITWDPWSGAFLRSEIHIG